jgi:UDP-N-acetylmuramate dehydrogenase
VGFVNHAAKAGLSGVEGLIGIPAHLGGAIAMNAGGKWGEIFDVVESVTTVDLTTGETRTRARGDCQPRYRDGNLGDAVVLEAVLRLTPGDAKAIQDATKEHLLEKNANQPVVEKSAGCIFKNPKSEKAAGRSAAKLIQDAGLKGTRVGGIEVSRKHSNYFVNLDGGSCEDALRLIDLVTEKVEREFGVRLETEVKIW